MSKDLTKNMTEGRSLGLILRFALPLLIGNRCAGQCRRVKQCAVSGYGILYWGLLWILCAGGTEIWRERLCFNAKIHI